MKAKTERAGVTNAVFGASVAVLLIVAAVGYGLYATASSKVTTTTSTFTTTSASTTTITSAITSTTTTTATTTLTTGAISADQIGYTAGFLNGKIVTFDFYKSTPPVCTPSLTQLFPNDPVAAKANGFTDPVAGSNATTSNCEAGAQGTFPNNAVPVWGMVPMFAGLSVFGIPSMGSTSQGFPTYNNQTVLTDCAAITSPLSCPGHPKLLYSPAFAMVEQSMGITSGLMGLPQGVMPFPAHTHIVSTDAGQANIPWDVISVLVWDPNIFPNPVTGQCAQTVPSSLSNATANCLTSIQALQAAMGTNNSDIAQANANNPVWAAMGKPTAQVSIPGDMQASQVYNANTNANIPFAVIDQNPYTPYFGNCPCVATTSSSTTSSG